MRKETAGSSVVPDLEMTFTSKSMSPSAAIVSHIVSVERVLPMKKTFGSSLPGMGLSSSIAPRAPR